MPGRDARLAAYVREILRRDSLSADDLEPLAVRAESPLTEATPGTGGQITPADLETIRKVERGDPLDRRESIRLEAIVLPNGLRPAFDILQDSYAVLPDAWGRLNDRRAELVPMIRAIGRVDLSGHPSKRIAGTAWVVAPDLLMTNRHVAEFFIDGIGDASSLHFKPGMGASVDFKQEVATPDSILLDVTAPALILDAWDAALLRVSNLPATITPLRLAGGPPPGIDGRLAAVVGYPLIDEGSDLVQQIEIFRGVFFKKRLMPGRMAGFRLAPSFGREVNALAHDCTTLGGNSGSPLVDVESGLVAGLHFAGEHLVSNYAVPSWELAADPRVAGAGVQFD